MGIERGHEQAIAGDREAAIDEAAARPDVLRHGPLVTPDLRPVRPSIAHALFMRAGRRTARRR